MSVTSLLSAIAPAYASDPSVGTLMNIAMQRTSRCAFGANYEYAVALRLAHMICRNPSSQPGTAGAVTSEAEGQLSRSYSISPELQAKYGDLCSTPYGCQLAELMEGNVVGLMSVSGGAGTNAGAVYQGDQL